MKRLFLLIFIFILSDTSTYGGVEGSPHDLRTGQGGQACVFCHTPYGVSQLKEKWFPSRQEDLWKPDRRLKLRVARLCLGCHDGSIAPDTTLSLPDAKGVKVRVRKNQKSSDSRFKAEGARKFVYEERIIKVVDTDQVYEFHDHPLGVRLKDVALIDQEIYKEPLSGNLKLYNGIIDCGTCHSVHNTTPFQPLLAENNSGSRLCLSCHKN
jgi:predicted CXXCH cytochrome family protein